MNTDGMVDSHDYLLALIHEAEKRIASLERRLALLEKVVRDKHDPDWDFFIGG